MRRASAACGVPGVAGARLSADGGVHAVVGQLGEVHGDEVIGVDAGLFTGEELLAGVLRDR